MRFLRSATSIVLAAVALAAFAGTAIAAHDGNPSAKVAQYTYDVAPVPHPATDANDAVSGTVRLAALPNGKVQVKVRLSGLTPNQAHAQHIHGVLNEANVCPDASLAGSTIVDGMVVGGSDFIATLDAAPAYGGIQASLTTSGDTTAASALAVDRFPVADAKGNLRYTRTFEVPADVHGNLGSLHYVVHGIDLDGSGSYDGAPSPLSAAVPFEATIPAGCAGNG